MDRLLGGIVRYRWYVGIVILAICVICEIHGSSIGMYAPILQTPDTAILGNNRFIRSDEWLVNTPLAFSQYYTNFSYFSDIVRAARTDMFMVYGQAVKDVAVIFRPFSWGYLFLSPAKGLSFYWMGRLIFLFLVSFEFGMFLCHKNKVCALVYAVALTFSPYVQWWYAVCFIAEILMFGQGGILLAKAYMDTDSYRRRFLYAVGFMWLLGSYALSLYPAWQVSCGYVFLGILIWVVYSRKGQLQFSRKDILVWLVSIIPLVCIGGHILQNSLDTVAAVKNTVYPGSRFCLTGGVPPTDFFRFVCSYALGLWLPMKEVAAPLNSSEAARMFDLMPLGIILAIYYLKKFKWEDTLLIFLLGAQALLLLWSFFTWPAWLAKITFLSNVHQRWVFAFGLANIMLLMRVLSSGKIHWNTWIALLISCCGAGFAVASADIFAPDVFDLKYLAGTFVIIGILWYFSLRGNLKIFACLMIIALLCAGARVNPVAKGADSIYQSPIVKEMQAIAKVDKGKWLVVAGPPHGIPIMAGAPTINSINTYPVLERWEKLDPTGEHRDLYNRYAHIIVFLTNDKTTYQVAGGGDMINMNLNVDDLQKWDVKYIFSAKDLSDLNGQSMEFKERFRDHNLFIYEVLYK